MFNQLKTIHERPKPYEVYTAEILWNDPHISKQMLALHLNETAEPASRNLAFINRSVKWITTRFNVGQHTRIADFGCGPGLYAARFAEKGASVTGIDFSSRSIEYAKNTAAQANLEIEYVRENYLSFKTDQKFDLITMIYCDFCALSPGQRKILLKKFKDYLDDNGSILLDVFSLYAFKKREETSVCEHQLMNGFWSANKYYGFMNTFKYEDEKVVLDKYSIIDEERSWKVYNWLQYFSRESIAKEFSENGLEIEAFYRNVAGGDYKPDAMEMAVVARKA